MRSISRVRLFTLLLAAIGVTASASVVGATPEANESRSFTGLSAPVRLLDTRPGGNTIDGQFAGSGEVQKGSVTTLPIAGRGGVPSSARTVALNITAVAPSEGGFITLYPCGNVPNSSNLNFGVGDVVANSAIARLSSSGELCIYTYGVTNVLVDVAGYLATGGGDTSPPPTNTSPPPTTTPVDSSLRFDFSNSVGLALADSSRSFRISTESNAGRSASRTVQTNLLKVASDGSTSPALSSGSATISRFLIAPNDKVYVLFESGAECLLGEVDRTTGIPTCIDSTLSSIQWDSGAGYSTNPIQFDGQGRIYYMGATSDGRRVLRRYSNGSSVDLINDNIQLELFHVQGDGSVFLTGQTLSNSATWLRRIAPNGSLANVVGTTRAQFIERFPDGNMYFGLWGTGNSGVRRYLAATNTLDSTFWIGDRINSEDPEVTYRAGDYCQGADRTKNEGFCGWFGTHVTGMHITPDGKVFAQAGSGSAVTMMQYFPTVEVVDTLVRSAAVQLGVMGSLIISGLDSNGRFITTLYNTTNGSEQVLIPASNEIEIYNLGFNAATNSIMFDGQRFSDNRYVIGRVDLATKQVTSSALGTGQLVAFDTFG